jgi:hypothetical protein
MRLILFLLMTACFACKSGKQAKQSFDKSVISMEKTACYGKCPVYTIVIYGTGKAEFTGSKNVKMLGKYEKQLSKEETLKIFNAFYASNFSDFISEYDSGVTDVPTTIISFLHKGYNKVIRDKMGAPAELKALEKMVEELVKGEGWTPISQ